jgi:hypothetical protein
MTFRVGQKVVCVNDGRPWKSWRSWLGHKWMEFRHPYDHPVIGVIYTVTDIQSSQWDGETFLLLNELDSGNPDVWEPGYFATMFRPVVEHEADISIFTKMLTPRRERLSEPF